MKRKRRIVLVVLAILFLYFLAWYLPYAFDSLKVAPDTTYLTDGPVVDGQFDFVAALNRRLSEGITPENNAFVKVLEAFGPGVVRSPEVYAWLGIDPLPAEGDYFIELSEYAKSNPPPPLSDESVGHRPCDRAHAALDAFRMSPSPLGNHEYITAFIAANSHALDRLVAASRRTDFYIPVLPGDDGSLVQGAVMLLREMRDGAIVLTDRGLLRMVQGRHEDARADFRAAHNLCRLLRQTPESLSLVVGVNTETQTISRFLEWTATAHLMPAEQLDAYLNDLQSTPRLANATPDKFLATRMAVLEMWSAYPFDSNDPTDFGIASRLWTVSINELLRQINRWYNMNESIWLNPDFAGQWAALSAIEADFTNDAYLQQRNPLGWLIPGRTGLSIRTQYINDTVLINNYLLEWFMVKRQLEIEAEAYALRDIAEVALALRIYEREHGAYPETLDALVPALLPSAPTDPFPPHGPLVYERTEGGFRLRAGREGTRRSASYEYPFPYRD